MRKVLILYSQKTPQKTLQESKDLYDYFSKKGVSLCRGYIRDYDVKKKIFSRALFLEKDEWIWRRNIIPDLVYDRSLFLQNERNKKIREIIQKDYDFFNNIHLSELFSNKWLTYKKFHDYCPKTVLIKNKGDIKKINQLNSAQLILKPLFGSKGKGIKTCYKNKLELINLPFIAQELILAKKGMRNFIKGPHDFRVLISNETPFHSFLRIPPKNSLLANLSQGGRIKLVPLEKIPHGVRKIINIISKKIKKYPKKLYAVDFIFDDNQKPWIIEINSRPGILLEKEELKNRENYYNHLINFLKK